MGYATENEILKNALAFAGMGVPVFPLAAGTKDSEVKEYPQVASRDPYNVRAFFVDPVMGWERPANIGLLMRGLVGIDIDAKEGRGGDDSVLTLELSGCLFPHTFTQRTPTGGTHLIYRLPPGIVVRNSAQKFAKGIDVRGAGGYLVGAGSTVAAGTYMADWRAIVDAPDWLLERLGRLGAAPGAARRPIPTVAVDTGYAARRGREIAAAAEPAVQGTRDSRAYAIACELRNLGVELLDAYDMLDELWAPRCEPPFPSEELVTPVENAYRYAKDQEPILAPEYEFDEIKYEPEVKKSPLQQAERKDPVAELNEQYAFVITGMTHHVLFETTDGGGRPEVQHISEDTFHKKLASRTMILDGKTKPVTKVWIESARRRSYDGLCFLPGKTADPRYYNLFRGFAVTPHDPALEGAATQQQSDALAMFLEHSLQNICRGDAELNEWLLGYFAHIFQRPWEKPGVAIVMRGKKGVGKNALIERVGHLLGRHFMVTAHKRYLVGNFNSHLEGLLGIVLDEAFWSGQRDLDGLLKDLVTGSSHIIERKGQEPYKIASCLRTFIVGNERWLVPATDDERRYAVFDVGEDRMQDGRFFDDMRTGMEAGGYQLLLRYFLDFDLGKVNPRKAPNTEALLDQKLRTQSPFERWWYDSLHEGMIKGSTFIDEWPTTVGRTELRDAYTQYKQQHRMGSGWCESAEEFGRLVKENLPPMKTSRPRAAEGVARQRVYEMPSLIEARKYFERRMGKTIKWEEDDSDPNE